MRYYSLRFDSLPEIRFAHGYDTANYVMSQAKYDSCEIVFIERGDVMFASGEEWKELIPAGALWFVDHSRPMSAGCPGGSHTHFTVCFPVSELKEISEDEIFELCNAESMSGNAGRDGKKSFTAVLPEYCPGMEGSEAVKALKNIVRLRALPTPGGDIMALGEFIRMLGELTAISAQGVGTADGKRLSGEILCYRAKQYIRGNVERKISCAEIAAELSISQGYLSRLFKENLGMTVKEYINSAKTERMKELLSDMGISLSEAGAAVGIDDLNYASRIFKKYAGMTYREYLSICNNH